VIAGAIFLTGFGGFYLSIGFLVAYLVVLLFVAEPLRNPRQVHPRLHTYYPLQHEQRLVGGGFEHHNLSLFYMIARFNGAGALIGLLLGFPYWLSVILIGILMTVYIVAGGMIATNYIQIIKAFLLVAGSLALAIFMLAQYSFSPLALFSAVESEVGFEALHPPAPTGLVPILDNISLNIALVLGMSGLTYILIRFLTVQDAKTARSSIILATWIISLFYLITPLLGCGAALLVGQDTIWEANPASNLAASQLADVLGGLVFFAFISAVAFVAVVAGLAVAASGAFAHDFYNNVFRNGEATEQEQFNAARYTSAAISVGAIILALFAQGLNGAFLVALAFTVAASANVPTILLTIFWRKFNTTGAGRRHTRRPRKRRRARCH